MNRFEKVVHHQENWSAFSDEIERVILGHERREFRFGVATSMFQDSGSVHCPDSQWTIWERKTLGEGERSGHAVSLFHLYQNDPEAVISRLKKLGVNCYRFSVEWSHLESEPGYYDERLVDVYIAFCKKLRDSGIEPLITLHHFSEPYWFHEIGSFEKEENISHFVSFCEWIVPRLSIDYQNKPLVEVFFTINEPAIEAHCRYLAGDFSPNLRFRFKRGALFLLNMLRAHCSVYESIKIDKIKVGICHQYLVFYPLSFLVGPVTRFYSEYHKAVLRFFKTGEFLCSIPLIARVRATYKTRPPVDLVGVQFYARIYLGLGGLCSLDKPKTQMRGVYEDPEGLYEAIVKTYEAFDVPVLVTENGISTKDCAQRARYLKRALFSAEQARHKIGQDNFLGYILWSFTDNFEWSQGWGQHFGAFAFDLQEKLQPNFKEGVTPLVEMIKRWRLSL